MNPLSNTSKMLYSPVPLRIAMGGGFAFHGYPKLFDPADHVSLTHIMASMGVPMANEAAWIIGLLEFFGGLAIISGTFTRVVATILAIELLGEISAHLMLGTLPPPLEGGQPLPGYENAILYIAGMLSLVITGAGGWSVDGLRARFSDQTLSAFWRTSIVNPD